jgi:hypothetical protein
LSGIATPGISVDPVLLLPNAIAAPREQRLDDGASGNASRIQGMVKYAFQRSSLPALSRGRKNRF